MKAKIKSKKWYGWFWPPERKKIKIMQAIFDMHSKEIELKIENEWRNNYIYGVPVIVRDFVPDNEIWVIPTNPFGDSKVNLKEKK